MSSHREAPEISKDPVADNTDVYAFVSPDKPDTVTMIANYIPLRGAGRRPELLRVRRRRPLRDPHRQRRRRRAGHHLPVRSRPKSANPNTFLYNTGPIARSTTRTGTGGSSTRSTRIDNGAQARRGARRPASPCPPCNIGPRSTPNYAASRTPAVHTLPTGEKVFAGQRNDGFYVDLGSIFDLGDLRPFQNLHLIPTAGGAGRRHATTAQRPHDRDPGADRAT